MRLLRIFGITAALLLSAALPAAAQTANSLGQTQIITPVIGTGAYSANQCIGVQPGGSAAGSAILAVNLGTIAPPLSYGTPLPSTGHFYIVLAQVNDAAAQSKPLVTYVFNAKPTGTYTDGSSCTLAAADRVKLIATYTFSNYTASSDAATTTSPGALASAIPALQVDLGPGNNTLYLVTYTTGAPTYTALALNFIIGLSY